MTWMLGLDVLIAVMLTAAIATAILLNRKLDRARQDWQALETLTGTFRQVTERADDSIRTLKLSTAALGREIDRADTALEDLRFLMERAGVLADRLESNVRAARACEGSPRPSAASPAAAPRQPAKVREEAERPQPPADRSAAPPLADRTKAPPPAAAPAARSQAERALLEALRVTP